MANLDAILDTLIEATLAGAAQVLAVRQSGAVAAEYKDARELVTRADKQSDAAILSVFRQRFAEIDPSVSFQLEESGSSALNRRKVAGADPLDGTNHFAAGGNLYSVQAHYVEDGLPLVGVVFQPELYLPLSIRENCIGRLSHAVRGGGAFLQESLFNGKTFVLSGNQPVQKFNAPETRTYVASVPIGSKMSAEERQRAINVLTSGLIATSTGTGGAGGNVMMAIVGGQHVYANFGAGDELDLIPPQVIAEEAGLTVWSIDRRSPVWNIPKQPFIVAPSPEIAEKFLKAAGL